MKVPVLQGILQKLNISPNKYTYGKNISKIILKTGEVITPSRETMRMNFKNRSLCLKYGISEGFGSLIVNPIISAGGRSIYFNKIRGSVLYEKIVYPKPGDMFRVSKNGNIIFETLITSSTLASNGNVISLAKPFTILEYANFIFSYYSVIDENELNMKGEIDGIYLKFIPSNGKEYHRKINYSLIDKIISSTGEIL